MQMPRRLLPTTTVCSATPSHAQNEREIYSRSEDEGRREGGRETETSYNHDSMCFAFPVSLRLLTSSVYIPDNYRTSLFTEMSLNKETATATRSTMQSTAQTGSLKHGSEICNQQITKAKSGCFAPTTAKQKTNIQLHNSACY